MLSIRPFTTADVPLGMRLKTQAGWNQLEADWRRMLAMQPDGCFVAEYKGTPAGTVMTCIFGEVAWIAMMLVGESLRGKGIGRALMEHALDFLGQQRIRTIRLDATPLGQPLYEKLGFAPQYALARYAGIPAGGVPPTGVQQFTRDLDELLFALDQAVTRTDRRQLLQRLVSERGGWVVRRSGQLAGYLLTRAGAHATQIGPCVADGVAGPLLLAQAFAELAGQPVYIDIPLSHELSAALAGRQGLTVQRQLWRMSRGAPIAEQVDRLW